MEHNIHKFLNFSVLILVSIGVIFIYSSSSVYADKQFGDSEYFLMKHLMYLFAGLLGMVLFSSIDYSVFKRHPYIIIFFCIALVALVYVPGIGVVKNGARRWINLRILTFQPSEILKYGFVIYMAYLVSKSQERISSFKSGFLPGLMVVGLVSVILLKQPDFGTTVLLVFTFLSLYFIAGTRLSYLFGMVLVSLPVVYFIIMRSPYKRARMLAFLNPEMHKDSIGYQIYESLISIGSGGIFGKGLGMSNQKLLYLPAAHTDFILAIVGEEIGFIGISVILLLFVVFIVSGVRIALRARDLFGVYLGFGITIMFAYQVLINTAVVMSLIPTKGLTLPFISYGGSSIIFSLIGVGILNSIYRNSDIAVEDPDALKTDVSVAVHRMARRGRV